MGVALDDLDFAVIDVETTGLNPNRYDRVIEIAIVRLMAGGRLTEEFVTLVNPERDLGPTHVHGIMARDIIDAPSFADIAGDVLDRLANAVVVAHNVAFDTAFLVAECDRAGHTLPEFPKLCTLRLSLTLGDSLPGRALLDCCNHFGIEVGQLHSAGDDARACALLLLKCLERASRAGVRTLEDLIGSSATLPAAWPKAPRSGKMLKRCEAQRLRESQPHYLARLVTRLMGPTQSGSPRADVTGYMGLLDKALEDRFVSESEAEALLAFAKVYGLSGHQVVVAHRNYLEALAQAAIADGIVSDSEQRDLLEVTRLLGFDQQTLDEVLETARRNPPAAARSVCGLAGKSVCFTGELLGCINREPISREQAEQLAANAGLTIAERVTRKLDLLVVADPLTLSTKAKKAREYGTRIMAEMAFWNAIGVAVD